jgi:hypothetical protein
MIFDNYDNVGTEGFMSDESWFHQMNEEARERQLYKALHECSKKGVSKESLLTLCFECGARWHPDETH